MNKTKAHRPVRSASTSKIKVNGATKQSIANNEILNGSTAIKRVPVLPLNPSKAQSMNAAKYRHRHTERQTRYLLRQRARRTRRLTWTAALLLVALLGGLGYWIYQTHASSHQVPSAPSLYQEPIFNARYQPVDHIYCDQIEGQVTHLHMHISIYLDGKRFSIPQFVGIAQDGSGNSICYYWLHTHDASGVIHIESPASAKETFTFGQFVDEWEQEFNTLDFPSQLLLTGGWTIWLNGHRYHGGLAGIPLNAHTLLTLAYNSPHVRPDTTYAWNGL